MAAVGKYPSFTDRVAFFVHPAAQTSYQPPCPDRPLPLMGLPKVLVTWWLKKMPLICVRQSRSKKMSWELPQQSRWDLMSAWTSSVNSGDRGKRTHLGIIGKEKSLRAWCTFAQLPLYEERSWGWGGRQAYGMTLLLLPQGRKIRSVVKLKIVGQRTLEHPEPLSIKIYCWRSSQELWSQADLALSSTISHFRMGPWKIRPPWASSSSFVKSE